MFLGYEDVEHVFPVYTGINRFIFSQGTIYQGVPCIHRDKPLMGGAGNHLSPVFPVYTGINRLKDIIIPLIVRVPCIHRDKPGFARFIFGCGECSLYTQG